MFSRSLALRILVVNATLIVLPLIIYFLSMFHSDYEKEIQDEMLRFRSQAFTRAAILNQEINNQYSAVALVAELLDLTNLPPKPDKSLIEARMQQIVREGDYLGVVFFEKDPKGDFLATYSAKRTNDGRDFSFREYVQLAYKNGRSAYLAEDINNFIKELLVSITLHSRDTYSFIGILTIFFDPTQLINLITNTSYLQKSERISLLTEDKIVFASSDPAFLFTSLEPISQKRLASISMNKQFGINTVPKQTLSLTPYSANDHIYSWQESGHKRLGVIMPVSAGSFYLMIDIDPVSITQNYVTGRTHLLILMGLITLFACLLTLVITQYLARPLKKLIEVTEKIQNGHLTARYQAEAFGFEINEAGMSLNEMVSHLTEETSLASQEKIKTELAAKDLKIGHEIQASLLPKKMMNFPGLDVASTSTPAPNREIGGDFFDIYQQKERVLITVAETAEKGISACFYAMGLRSMLRSFSTAYSDVKDVLSQTDHLFHHDLQNNSFFVKVFIASWDSKQKTFDYASAGLSFGFVIFSNGDYRSLNGSKAVIGSSSTNTFDSYTLTLQEGDIVVLYTKGAIEIESTNAEAYGEHSLKSVVKANKEAPAQDILKAVEESINRFSQGMVREDDMTIVILKIKEDHV